MFETGDEVAVVFWRPFPMPGDPGYGSWETLSAVVVSCGRLACVELSSPTVPYDFALPPAAGSTLRFVSPERVFRDHDEARKFAAGLKRPAA